ncbi:uncharacterized protein BDW43DRAFT_305660 [Aspergillus alliaceus]|uniref:uncharacterized protein n=1 Tax=Petromyces alliaceus TaxID=209559 RepID=UPI0012A65041|nr:uncharacterized protein BDW43DRAFT_305660 [Aspergillus alliaceus]KAB8238754.1 hypothetical protein BDW43DRAFT_305660 [Aspergillus alliaceus]
MNTITIRARNAPRTATDLSWLHHGEAAITLGFLGARANNTKNEIFKNLLQNFHPYLPILPSDLFAVHHIQQVGLEGLHRRISEYMEKLLLRVILGAASVRHVGVMEGLLLLAEWVPHIRSKECAREAADSNGPSHQVQATAEDSVAWSLIGLALRQPYLLHLELYSFRGECKDKNRGQVGPPS